MSEGETPIIFFDGDCGLCDRAIRVAFAADKRHVFRFAPLQGETAKALLAPADIEGLGTLVLRDASGTYRRSDALARICAHLGGWWSALALIRLVPRPIRDGAYSFVARHRQKWFAASTHCRVLAERERRYFLP